MQACRNLTPKDPLIAELGQDVGRNGGLESGLSQGALCHQCKKRNRWKPLQWQPRGEIYPASATASVTQKSNNILHLTQNPLTRSDRASN